MTWVQIGGATIAAATSRPIVTGAALGIGFAASDGQSWAVLLAGLLIGMMARWAMVLRLERPLGWRELRIDALIILANGLLAAQFAEALGLQGVRLATAAMMFGASSTMIFAKLHEQFVARIERGGPNAPHLPGDATVEIPASGPAPDVLVVKVAPGTPTRGELRKGFPPPAEGDDEIERLVKRLGDDI